MQQTQSQIMISFEDEKFSTAVLKNKAVGVGEQMCEAVGRGTGKLQRKLEAHRLPPSRTRQCTGKNATQRRHINTSH